MRVNTYLMLGASPLFVLGSWSPLGDNITGSYKRKDDSFVRVGVCPNMGDRGCSDPAIIGRYDCQEWGLGLRIFVRVGALYGLDGFEMDQTLDSLWALFDSP